EKIEPILEEARPNFQEMVVSMGEMILESRDSATVVYELLYDESGETHAYPVFFIRDEFGNWKIWDL
ncbi:unnamed protein product, partial [marine sediment metagenome]